MQYYSFLLSYLKVMMKRLSVKYKKEHVKKPNVQLNIS